MSNTPTSEAHDREKDKMLPEYDFDYQKARPNRFALRGEGGHLMVTLGGCPRINIHPSVGVGLSAWMSSLALFCRLGYPLNTARGDVPDAVPTTKGLLERPGSGSEGLKPSSRHFHSATA
jgi:hypothetical protein